MGSKSKSKQKQKQKPSEDIIMVDCDSDDDEDVVPRRVVPPEKEWAQKVNKGLFAGLARSSEQPKVSAGGAHRGEAAIPLRSNTHGGEKIPGMLREQEVKLNTHMTAPPRPSPAHPDPPVVGGCPLWSMGSMDCLRTSMGFLEEHIASLVWLQECLINHQKVLLRTRGMNQAMLESINRAIYIQDRYRDIRDVLDGEPAERGGDPKD